MVSRESHILSLMWFCRCASLLFFREILFNRTPVELLNTSRIHIQETNNPYERIVNVTRLSFRRFTNICVIGSRVAQIAVSNNSFTFKIPTCLNASMMSFDSSISLNMPSSLLVKPPPHSVKTKHRLVYGQVFSHTRVVLWRKSQQMFEIKNLN